MSDKESEWTGNGDITDPKQPLLYNNRAGYGSLSGSYKEKQVEVVMAGNGDGAHCHKNSSAEDRVDRKARRQLIIASIVCLLFMIGEIVGGILANSLAIATDAAHLLTDFASFMISLFAIFLASRPATKRMSFGWYRAEVMGALISVLLIWVVTGVLVFMAIQRVMSGDYEIDATVMLITAGVGVGVNLIMGCTLHEHGHSHGGHGHSHGHSHSDSDNLNDTIIEVGSEDSMEEKKTLINRDERQNINVRAAFIHVVGDFIQSLGVLIAAIIIFFRPEWKIADPICTFLFSVLVLFTTIAILRDTLQVLMEGTPRGISFKEVKSALCEIKGVRELHNLRIWSLTMSKTALAVHLACDKSNDSQTIVAAAQRIMRERFKVHECTIQVEEFTSDMEECKQCMDPQD